MNQFRRGVTIALTVVLLVSGASEVPARAAVTKRIPKPAAVASVPGKNLVVPAPPVDPTASADIPVAKPVTWPAPATTTVVLGAGASAPAAAPGTPVRIGAPSAAAAATIPGSVKVEVLDHAAGAASGHPVVVRLTRGDGSAGTPGTVRLSLDYKAFRNAYGGDWSNRLRLVRLPECALSTPSARGCHATDLGSVNDPGAGTVSATVTLTPSGTSLRPGTATASSAMVALAAGPQSATGGGDYAATALAATSSWSAGGQAGDFSWSYPIRAPGAFGGPAPSVGFSYSAQSLDGKTGATNNQPSWVGDGFDYVPGSISRAFPSCVDDGKSGVGDLCWGTDNATLSLPGHGGELLQVSTSPDVWRLKQDDGTVVERLTGATNDARNGEYWRVTTTDGTQYYFGLNRLPGWSGGKPVTNSVFYVPVFGNNSDDPCYNATFANAWCQQAYAWNLDYVVDPHGNSMSLWYTRQLNQYARNVTDTAVSTYVRGGQVDHIDYGTRLEGGVDSDYSAGVAPARVLFGLQDRCVTQGSTCRQPTKSDNSTASNWPDVPWDQQCDSTSNCSGVYAATFFSSKMLNTVTTQVWSGGGTTYNDVEQWTLGHVFKDPGDGHAKTLWLNSIGHVGLNGGEHTTTPDVSFTGVQLNNRVDTTPSKDPIIRYRISSVVNEAGGVIAVTYSRPECVLGSHMPASADTNTMRCYPSYWTPYGQTNATFDWFHKYIATGVTVTDPSGGSPAQVYTYTPIGGAAWHYDNSEIVPAAHKSWGQWRGYGRMRVVQGSSSAAQLQTDTVFFRGMNGDKTPTGTRSVQLPADPDFAGSAIDDEDWRAGKPRETITYNGLGDSAPVVSKKLTEPWEFGPTATRTRAGVTTKAYITDTRSMTMLTALDAGRGWQTTRTTNTFDADLGAGNPIGLIVKTDEANDVSTSADDRCTVNTYANDPNGKIRSAVAEVVKYGVSCAATPNPATDVISDTRTWYDGAASFDKTVTVGDVTRTEQLADASGASPVYVARSRATYDGYGRVLTSTDVLGNVTRTAYAPAGGRLPTSVAVTNPMGWTSTDTMDPAYGVPTVKVDPNGSRTDLTYDGLGRLVGVWLPQWPRSAHASAPSVKYGYLLGGASGFTAVSTATLDTDGSGYLTSYQIYDSQLRKRQTQIPAAGGGAILTDTLYDSRGLAVQANDAYFSSGISWGVTYLPSSPVPGRTITDYDNAGRAKDVVFQVDGVEKWRTGTTFGGDHTDTTAAAGGIAKSTYMNALGQTTKVRMYHGSTPTGAFDETVYGYDKRGNTSTITDPSGSVWQFFYDQRGRSVKTVDPDRGRQTYTYDDADQQTSVTDARGVTLTSVHDALGRVTERYQGDASTGTLLVSTTYDTLAKGQQSATTRYVDGNAYVSAITGYDAAYRVTGASITIPSSEGQLAGTYTTATSYNADGTVATTGLPALGGLPAETVSYGYNGVGLTDTVSGLSTYVTHTAYDSLGRIGALFSSDGGGKTLAQIWAYEHGTNRMLEHGVYDNDSGTVYQDEYYTYNDAGSVTSIKDLTNQYGAGPDDNQCFSYDYFARLSAAWTPANGNCAAPPSTSALGGPSPYWQSWTYDAAGDRTAQTDHATAGDTTATSTYPAATATRPHAQTQVTTTGPAGTKTDTYQYDADGNTTTRALSGKPAQTLTYDAEGHLATVTDSGSSAGYVYDAGGNRLVAHDSTGVTLYLGAQQLHISTGGAKSATRYYGANAVRTTGGGLFWTTNDQHGTNNLTFKAADLSHSQRRTTPFGAARGANPAWPTDRGFVGGYSDPTGLTQLGARPYDPALGRFITVDPKFSSDDPQSFNGYAYAHDNPTTSSDPSGLQDIFKVYLGSTYYSHRGNGYTAYYKVNWFAICRSDGYCLGPNNTAVPFLDDNMLVFGVIAWVVIVYQPKPVVPWLAPKPIRPIDHCAVTPPPPPPPPSCGFFDFKCGWDHPGWWWSGNKGWVEAGVAVAGIAACATGVGCLATAALGAGISAADRTYSFAHNKEYQLGASAWAGFGLGLGLDALGVIPGEGMAAKALGPMDHVAFGRASHGLNDFADKVGARTLMGFGEGEWQGQVINAIDRAKNGQGRISFMLDGLEAAGQGSAKALAAARRAETPLNTQWELMQVADAGMMDSVDFYRWNRRVNDWVTVK